MSSLRKLLNNPNSLQNREPPARIKKKRKRVPLSCNFCRYRKIKCDRKQPCGSCVTFNLKNCQYHPSTADDTTTRSFFPIMLQNISDNKYFHYSETSLLTSKCYSNNEAGPSGIQNNNSKRANDVSPLLFEVTEYQSTSIFKLDVFSGSFLRFGNKYVDYCGHSCSRAMKISNLVDCFLMHKKYIKPKLSETLIESVTMEKNQEKIIIDLAERLSKGEPLWHLALKLLPPRDLIEYLVERFLNTINIIHHSLIRIHFTETLSSVYCMYESREKDPGIKIDIIDAHRLSLVLLVLLLARQTFKDTWKPSDSTKNFDHDYFYFGHKLHLIPFAAVTCTNNNCDCNFIFLQLLYYLWIYDQSMLCQSDYKRNSISSIVSNTISQTVSSMGLHRDPDNFPNVPSKYFDLWRLLWKQMVYIDTFQAIEFTRPPMIDLKYSDIRLVNDNLSSKDIMCDFDRLNLEWCLLARSFLNNFLLVPTSKVDNSTIKRLQESISLFESVYLIPYNSIIEHIQSSIVQNQLVEMCYAFYLWLHLELLNLRFLLLNAWSESDYIELLRTATKILDVNTFIMDNSFFFCQFNHVLACTSIRTNNRAWTTVIGFVLTEINSKIEIDSGSKALGYHCDSTKNDENTTKKSQSVSYLEHIDVPGILRKSIQSFKWMNRLSQISYTTWKDNLIMANVLKHFFCILSSKNTNLKSSMLVQCESILQEANVNLDILFPREQVWFDWISREFESEFYG